MEPELRDVGPALGVLVVHAGREQVGLRVDVDRERQALAAQHADAGGDHVPRRVEEVVLAGLLVERRRLEDVATAQAQARLAAEREHVLDADAGRQGVVRGERRRARAVLLVERHGGLVGAGVAAPLAGEHASAIVVRRSSHRTSSCSWRGMYWAMPATLKSGSGMPKSCARMSTAKRPMSSPRNVAPSRSLGLRSKAAAKMGA